MIDRLLSELRYRWRALVHRGRMEEELDRELRFHVERETEKLVAQGMPPHEARRRAHVRFGGHQRIAQDTREVRGVTWLEQGWADLRYALRVLRARPAFTIGVAGTLALGLGANAAMFGIVDRLMFRVPEGLVDADRVHRVHMRYIQDGEPRLERSMQFARFRDFERSATSVDLVGAFQVREVAFGTGEQVREERLAVVSAGYLGFFDAPPALGRWFTAAEDEPPTGTPVVVLSHAYWQSAYGGRSDVLGRTVQVDRLTATIIGVAPPGFAGINDAGAPVAFVPMSAFAHAFRGTQYLTSYNWSWLEILVRRKPGVSIAEANADLSAAYRVSWRAEEAAQGQTYDVAVWKPSAEVGPVHLGRGPDAGLDSRVTLWTTGVALIVLLIACANVANLLLSRAVSRQREIALRLALGVGRWRLTRQLLLEGVVLGLLGGAGGILLARFGGGALRALLLPDADATAVLGDGRTIVWSMILAVLAGLLTGVVPSFTAARTDVASSLKEGGRGSTQRRSLLRASLVVTQAALSLVLLVGAGLFVRSLSRAEQHRLGIDIDPVLYAEANMRGVRLDAAGARALMHRMLDAAE
ncbi:MAG: ABC transporter permease, partial [Cytophagaceae bacterium]|nr:ABC transporter permease [Gemmatimonadaceae bacterium]